MRTRAKEKAVASDRTRRENVPRHILFYENRSLIMQNSYKGGNAGPITEEVVKLQKRRVKMILTNLVYFIALLIIALIMFFMNAGQWIYLPIAAVLVF